MYKQTKAYTSIRNKLMATVAMLLVASIMMVSSSYAWFTLSTAPEVTGVTTTVGANGNLEIALSPEGGLAENIGTGQGTSMEVSGNVETSNRSWGNLVDLSDGLYGLDKIILKPASASISEAGYFSGLVYPQYGYDGRVTSTTNTQSGNYNNAAGKEYFELKNEAVQFGVRAEGSAISMSEQQKFLSDNKKATTSAALEAKYQITKVLNDKGSALAHLLINGQMAETSPTYTDDDKAVITALLTGVNASLVQVEASLKAAFLGYFASLNNDTLKAEETFKTISAAAKAASLADLMGTADITSIDTAVLSAVRTEAKAALQTPYDKYIAARTAYGNAKAEHDKLTDGSYTWETAEGAAEPGIKDVLGELVATTGVKLNGKTVTELKTEEGMNDVVNQVLSGSGIKVTMANGSGLFADMAELVGDYTAAIELKNIKYSGMTLGTDENPVAATMSTTCVGKETTQVRQAYLEAVKTAASSLTANSTTASATPLNDVYGYIIDLFVRTNAGGSSLLLQTAAANRIYDDGQNEDVMGGGANMTFTLGQGVKLDDAKNLLKAFRIVFFDRTNNGKVYAEARLDSTSVQTVLGSDGTTQYQVPMKIWIPESTETVDSTTTTYTPAHFAGEAVAQEVNGVEQTEAVISGEKPVITALTQNAATSVSVLVYIDGTNLTNADVANAATSMTGKLNLQFSSDADLKPMDYSPLKEPKPAS